MTNQEKQNTYNNLLGALKGVSGSNKKEILLRKLDYFCKCNKELALKLDEGHWNQI
jgi:hypothetical protein